jgi:hypothetical protein
MGLLLIYDPSVMKGHASEQVVNPQWEPFEFLCRDLRHYQVRQNNSQRDLKGHEEIAADKFPL